MKMWASKSKFFVPMSEACRAFSSTAMVEIVAVPVGELSCVMESKDQGCCLKWRILDVKGEVLVERECLAYIPKALNQGDLCKVPEGHGNVKLGALKLGNDYFWNENNIHMQVIYVSHDRARQ